MEPSQFYAQEVQKQQASKKVYSTDEIKKEIEDLRRIRDGKIKPKAPRKSAKPKSTTASPSLAAKLDEIDPLPFRTGFRASSDVTTATTEEALLSGTQERSGMFLDNAVVHTREMKTSTHTESTDRLSRGFSADTSDAILTSSSGAMSPLKPPLPLKLPSTDFFDREAKKETKDGGKRGLLNRSRSFLARMKSAGTKTKQQDELFPAASSDDMDSDYLLG
jgi:hypothetical protein